MCTLLITAMFTVPTLFELEMQSYACVDPALPNTTNTYYYVWGSEYRDMLPIRIIYRVVLFAVFISMGPFVLITVVTFRMIHLVRQANLLRREMNAFVHFCKRLRCHLTASMTQRPSTARLSC